MRVLITGGAGFIGSHLCRRLLADGHEVSVVDNESNGTPDVLPRGVWYLKGDVIRTEEVEPAFARGLDAVCHIAGQVSIIRAFDNPVNDLRTNTEGTVNILQLCRKYKVPRLLYASSMTIYGNGGAVPTPETERCVPDSYYGITKHAAERYVHSTAERPDLGFDLKVTSLRMFSVYGPGQAFDNPYQGVLGIFIGNLLRGEPIRIFGDGEQTRDFVYIGDVVEGWVSALNRPEAVGQVINLGSGRARSIRELAETAIAAFDPRGGHEITYLPGRPGEQRRVQADIARAGQILGWQPRTPYEHGLAETVRWAKELFGATSLAMAVSGGAR